MGNRQISRIILFFLVLFTGASLSALSINKLKSNPDRYCGDNVRLRGDVTFKASIPLTGMLVYILDDGSGSVLVFSAFPKEKGDRVSIRADVVAYVGEENKKGREKVIERISDYLVDKDILDRNKAEKVSDLSLKFINSVADAATGVWFVIEQEKTTWFNL